MPVVPARTFETWLRTLDGDAFAAFVADLYAARGRDASVREDGAVVVRDADRVLTPVADAWRVRTPRVHDDADAVVAASPSPRLRRAVARRGLTLLGPSDLRNLALYGIDRRDTERLFAEYFDQSPAVAAQSRFDGADDGPLGRFGEVTVASVAAVVLAGLVVAAVLGPFGPGVAPAADDAAQAEANPVVVGGSEPADDGDEDDLFPPGIGPTGVVDAETLAEAHADAVAGRSYRLVVRQSGTRGANGRVWRGVWQQAEVEDPRHFRYTVTGYAGVERSTDAEAESDATPAGESDAANATEGTNGERTTAPTDSTNATGVANATGPVNATGAANTTAATNGTAPIDAANATDATDATDGNDTDDDPREGVELVQYAAYADGELVYVMNDRREESFFRYPVSVDDDGHGVFERRAAFAVTRFLNTPRTNVTRESRARYPFRVVATGTPEYLPDGERISDYRAEATVGSDGFVSLLTVSYDLSVGNDTRAVSYRMEYASMGEVEVSRPVWYDRAVSSTRPAPVTETPTATETGPSAADTGGNGTATGTENGAPSTETATDGTASTESTSDESASRRGGTPTEPKRPPSHRDAVRRPPSGPERG